jgi:hypothetical protein
MKYALIYGAIAGAIVVSIISASIALGAPTHNISVLVGYLIMLAALSLIFVGVKRYRDVECGGVIRFGRAFGLGLGMSLVAAIVYTAGWETFEAVSDVDFIGGYARDMIDGMRADGATQAAIEAQLAELKEMTAMYNDPVKRIPMIFIEIFPVGLLVSLVSAAILRNPRVLPARA